MEKNSQREEGSRKKGVLVRMWGKGRNKTKWKTKQVGRFKEVGVDKRGRI